MVIGEITLKEIATYYTTAIRPTGLVVADSVVVAQLIRAVKYYEGFSPLVFHDREDEIDENTTISKSERSVISPLFELYVERENALILEASRSLGVEVYGRTISEITVDITQKELEIQNLAFEFDIFTV